MTSKDDDTLPLPGFSHELTPDVTIDEDFIPTSQPQSVISSKISKNSDISLNKFSEELISHGVSTSRIDDTLPREAIIDQSIQEYNKSADFIPDTETKKLKITYAHEGISCKKKLAVLDAFGIEENTAWDEDVSRIPESPALDTEDLSFVKEIQPSQEAIKEREESVTEIIVNDSAETVDLETTPVKLKKSESMEKTDFYCSLDVDRCEDTQIFDNSSILFLDQPGPSGLGSKSYNKISESIEKSYLQETVEDNKENSQDRANAYGLQCTPPLVTDETSRKLDSSQRENANAATLHHNATQPKPIFMEPSNNPVATRVMEFKLRVSCLISVNMTTKKILQKSILNVKEIVKTKPKPPKIEQPSDNASEKSKRHSTSSSGSVYSDKTGLPFALNKRLSTVSDLTDSSEDDLAVSLKKVQRKHGRTPWSNEYLFPLALDDIIQAVVENEDFLKKPVMSSPRKPKSSHQAVKQLKEILESSSSSLGDSPVVDHMKANNVEERMECLENVVPEFERTDENIKDNVENKKDSNVVSENVQFDEKGEEPVNESEPLRQKIIKETRVEEETTSSSLSGDLPVFARWTDKRYYSGVLSGDVKNDRWEVKFDDGTSKAVREDFIIPADWVKVGALVFALVDDKYESGQVIDLRRGKEIDFVVELDIEKKEVSVKISDLCLTDVMAGIVREKYRPLTGTPRGGRAEIDFDNVLSGKRLREQRTPLKPPLTVGTGSSGLKKKSSKTKKDGGQSLQSIKGTPPNKGSEVKIRALTTDNGHLVEDKVISADSPSGNDTGETPIRKVVKENPEGKAKPRSLSYETEETRSGKGKSWLAPDGTPIPGPSGVKSKRQKTKSKVEIQEKSLTDENDSVDPKSTKKSLGKASKTNEKSKRKRKLDELIDESIIEKKSLKEGKSRVKTRSRKG